MKQESLTLRGFIGIKRGLGIDEVTIDFSNLLGLIAFDGENGRGKTTVLDNLHPYRRLASREGSLQHHVFLRDSYKDFSFRLNGHHYRTLIKIDAQSGRQEGYIWKDGEPQVSGKATEYDGYIEELTGSPKLFFQSAFAAQGGKSIADLTEGDMKKLFAEFLQLERLAEFEGAAKSAGNTIADRIEVIRRGIKTAEEQIVDKADLQKNLSDKESLLNTKKTEVETTKAKVKDLATKLEKIREAAAAHRTAEQRRQELAREKTDIEKQIKSCGDTFTRDKKDIEARIAGARKSLAEKRSAMEGRNQLQAKKIELQQLEQELPEKEGAIEKALKEVDSAQGSIEIMNRELNEHVTAAGKAVDQQQSRLDSAEEKLRELERRRAEIDKQLQALENDKELTRMSFRINELETTAAKKDMLPAKCDPEICPFITDARKAEAELRDVRKQHEKRKGEVKYETDQLRAELRHNQWEHSEKQMLSKHAAIRKKQLADELEQGRTPINTRIEAAAKTRDAAKEKARKLQKEAGQIKKRQTKLRGEIESMPNFETLEAEIRSLNEKITDLDNNLARQQAEHERQVAALKTRVSEIDTAVAALPLDPQAEELARKKTTELESTQKSVADTETAINSLQSEVAVLEHRLKECAKTEEKISADRQRITELNAELAEWRYIQQACGKDGLQALEIDGTAPMIAQNANDLLTATFGPGMTVGFRTLDDDGKECLDIVVYRDGDEDDKGTLLKNLSGGEEVWVLKALRLALTLTAKEKSGRDIATALADEEDGALDETNAINFITLYRAFMTAGGFDACLYITHRDACKQMADHVVRFADNGVRIMSNNAATKAA